MPVSYPWLISYGGYILLKEQPSGRDRLDVAPWRLHSM